MTNVNDPNDPNYIAPGTDEPVAEYVVREPEPARRVAPAPVAVEPARNSLKWLWWLLGLLALGALIWGLTRACHREEIPVATPVPPIAEIGDGENEDDILDPDEQPDYVILGEGTTDNPATISVRWWGGDARQAMQLEAIEAFEALHPNIRVNPEPSSLDGYFDALGVQMAGGNEPDVFTLGGAWPTTFAREGTLLELSNNPAIDLAPFAPAVLADATVDGRVYAVPTGGNATAVVINPRIFEEAGVELPNDDTWTWEEFIDIANQIGANTPDGTFGVEMRPEAILGSFAAQRDGIGFYTEDGELNVQPETLAAYFQMILDLQNGGGMPGAALQSELSAVGPEETLMGRGLGAMLFAPSNQIGAFATSSGDDLILMRIPGETEFQSVGVAITPSQWWAIGRNSAYPASASAFVDFMLNSPQAGAIMGVDRGNPLNESVAEAIADTLDPMQEQQVHYVARVGQYAGQAIAQPAGAEEQPTISVSSQEEVAFGRMTPEQAAQSWITRMQTELAAAN